MCRARGRCAAAFGPPCRLSGRHRLIAVRFGCDREDARSKTGTAGLEGLLYSFLRNMNVPPSPSRDEADDEPASGNQFPTLSRADTY